MEKQFTGMMRFQRIHPDYYTILSALAANPNLDYIKMTEMQFEGAKSRFGSKNLVQRFVKEFLAARNRMIEERPKEFMNLVFQHRNAKEAMEEARKYNNVAIASTRDRKSLAVLLNHFGIMLDEKNIITKEFSEDKGRQIEELSRRNGVPVARCILIDNNPENIRMARKVGANAILAYWENPSKEWLKFARQNKVAVLKTPKKLGATVRRIARIRNIRFNRK